MKNVISQSLGLDLVNINVYATVYQNIPLSLKGRAIFTFQNLALGKASTDDKCHFAIPWARSCQYQCVAKFYQTIPNGWRVKISLFSEFEPRQNLDQSQSLRLDLVNINVYPQVYQNIPLSSRDRAIFFFFFQNLNLGNASANPKWYLTIPWATSCQYQYICKILSKYSKRFKSYRHFSRTGQGQNLQKQSKDKIYTNCPVTKSNVWL